MESWVSNYIYVLSLLTYAGAYNGLLLTIIFATYRKGNTKANRFFLLVLLILTLRLTDLSLYIAGEIWRFPFLSGPTYPLLFLIGPALFLYTKKLWDSAYKLKLSHLLMIIPTIWALWDSSGWIFYNLEAKAEILKNADPWVQEEIAPIQFVKFGVLIVHTAIYLGLIVRDLKKYRLSIEDSSSNNDQVLKLDWLKKLAFGLFLYVGGFFITMVALATTEKYGLLIDRAWIVVLTFFIHAVGFLAIQQPKFFSKEVEIKPDEAEGTVIKEKYKNSPLEKVKAEEYFKELIRLMEEEKLYLNPDLKVSEVASEMGIPTYQLSHLLSIKSEYNFFDFINSYRVQEAMRLLSEPNNEHLTILGIGFEAGFNNKSSFNRAFKKFTGNTPSDYKKEYTLA